MGILARLWGALLSRQSVGVDKAGNTYYRKLITVDVKLTEKRWVKFKGVPDPKNVPVEWTSWLCGQRKEAPTPEEIAAMEAHRKLVKTKAEMIEKEEEKRRFRSKAIQQDRRLDDTMKPEDVEKFVQQIARLEGIDTKEDGMLAVDGQSSTEELVRPTDEKEMIEQEKRGLQSKEPKQVYEKWVPPQ